MESNQENILFKPCIFDHHDCSSESCWMILQTELSSLLSYMWTHYSSYCRTLLSKLYHRKLLEILIFRTLYVSPELSLHCLQLIRATPNITNTRHWNQDILIMVKVLVMMVKWGSKQCLIETSGVEQSKLKYLMWNQFVIMYTFLWKIIKCTKVFNYLK